jgi:fermentation-respiration switch protein FrsA (DUF1100 family)
MSIFPFINRLIYFPSAVVPPVPRGVSEVSFETEPLVATPPLRGVRIREDRLRLKGWLVPPAAGHDRRLVVLVANGNGGNRSDRLALARALAGHGLTVLLFDYRGYGGNPGTPSESGLYEDIKAAYGYLTESFPPQRVILFGESLGSAVATDLAARHPCAGLVLRSPFVDLASVGASAYPFLPVRLVLRDSYPLARKVTAVKAPVLVVYGTRDSIVAPRQSIAVAEKAGVEPIAVEGADHNDPALLDGPEVVGAVLSLAARVP